jgi:HAD hydrolase, family IA, variant 3
MMLATIGEPELVQSALIRLKVWKYFKGMMTCEELQTTKRESMIYRKAAEIMGTKPKETLVFEDILQAVQSAKKAGFLVCAVADDSSRADRERIAAEADFLIEDFTELSKVIALAGI